MRDSFDLNAGDNGLALISLANVIEAIYSGRLVLGAPSE